MAREMLTDSRSDQAVTSVVWSAKYSMAQAMKYPVPNPIKPPMKEMTIVSTRNCMTMSRFLAPSARRTPISRVRSVTLASMMFMMPMPPTRRLMAAMAPSMMLNRRPASSAARICSRGTVIV